MKNVLNSRLLTCAAAIALAAGIVLPVAGCGGSAVTSTDAGSAAGSAAVADAAAITVNLNIDGSLGEEGAESNQVVTVPAGSSVLDALEASNAQITVEDSDYGPYVTIINGIAAHDNYGWVYDVNGEEIMVGAAEYELADGDTVNWTLVSFE